MNTDTERPAYHKSIGYQTLLLGVMALLASALLAIAHVKTHEEILLRKKEDLLTSLGQVIPSTYHDNDLTQDTVEVTYHGIDVRKDNILVYRALKEQKVTAVAFEVSGYGYSSPIVLVMGVDRDGVLLGVRTVSHTETPGLGDNIEIKKTKWITSFNGHSLTNTTKKQWAVKKDGGEFDQFTGATITPRTVVQTVHKGLQFFSEHRDQLLEYKPPESVISDFGHTEVN